MSEYENRYRAARDKWAAADSALRDLVMGPELLLYPDDAEEAEAAHKAEAEAWDAWAAVRAEAPDIAVGTT
jgi:hypothetical protein